MRFPRFGVMSRIEEMLEDAINDTFEESAYDESRISRLEVKWKRFLSSSVSSKHRLLEEQKKIKMLISDISHQTKTPLANILLYAQILQEKETNPELVPIVTNIKEQSEKLDFLIRSLVKVSRLESEVLMLKPKREAIMPCIRAAVAGAEEALGNLLDNAIKYSPVGSEVRIQVKDSEMFAAVLVTDAGIGIREEEQAQVFERFYRSAEAAEEKGVGIGLYLVRKIAAKQGGYVRVKSRHGAGSTFSFYMAK